MDAVAVVQDWLSKNFDGPFTISRMKSGEIMISTQQGADSVAVLRKTFVEAATVVLSVK